MFKRLSFLLHPEPAAAAAAAAAAPDAAAVKVAREFITDVVSNPQDVDDVKAVEIYGKIQKRYEPQVKALLDAELKKSARAVPEKYTAAAPQGSMLAPEAVERVHAGARAAKLVDAEAGAVLGLVDAEVKKFWEAKGKEYQQKMTEWVTATAADKEIGGAKAGDSAELSKRVVAKFGTPEFAKMMEESGIGNHPEFVRIFYRIAKTMSDDQLEIPKAEGTQDKGDMATRLYGKTQPAQAAA